jgi:exopolysaccharide production protein ExoZ
MLTSLQAGRAFAALAVAAFHLSLMMGAPRYGGVPVLQAWTSAGNLGVDFFFVLSGFVILMAHDGDIGRPPQVGQYVWKRFVRVYPIYLLYTAVFVVLVLAGLGKNSGLPETFSGWISTLTLIRLSPESTPISPAWTLFHEVGFYALFAVLILSRRVGLLVLGGWLAACAVIWQYPPEQGRTAAAVYFSAYAFHFVLGMCAFLAYSRLRENWLLAVCIGFACVGALLVASFVGTKISNLSWAVGFAGVLLVATTLETRFHIRVPSWICSVGDASYSLYLLHLALQGLLLKVLIGIKVAPMLGGVGVFVAVMLGTILLSCVAYKYAEAPLLRALRGRFN